MVFYYTIRGGQCLNNHSHITLGGDDIICYVGRDKHENEYLIKYGWPGDVWFHVDGLSSAHVYFRLKNTQTVSAIPIDDIPVDSIEDMMQICKNNSISGCKLASCKMVYTPHSNLKKTFDMESGAVTYHDTKLCRYARCDKDRQRVRELEKTKTADIKVDYYQELKDNERRIIERKKQRRREANADDMMYDPIRDDIQSSRMKGARQGDAESGLDVGLEALEGLSFAKTSTAVVSGANNASDTNEQTKPDEPLWVQEEEAREGEPLADVRFLRERGYSSAEATAACRTTKSRIAALSKVYNAASSESSNTASVPDEEVVQARIEEKEVLLAMFGFAEDEDAAKFSNMDDETMFDVVLPITTYEAPERYDSPPPLYLEVYVDNNIAPMYPNEPPVLAVVGGGFSEARLRELTKRIQAEALERVQEEPGEPQVFNLMTFVGEAAEAIVQEEAAELKAEREKLLEEQKAAAAALRPDKEEEEKPKSSGFMSEAERRAYAKDVVAKAGTFDKASGGDDDAKKTKKYNAKTGVSDQSLIDDLFG